MALITKAIKGTKDVLPNESYKTNILRLPASVLPKISDIRKCVRCFEHTELFKEVSVTLPM